MKPILNKNDVEINIKKAKKILENGDLVIFPTETVYGLGGNATDKNAIKKIYNIKNRPSNNPLICHFKNISSIEKDFVINDTSYELANKFWPGPLTLILEKKEASNINPVLSNHNKFVGCRIPKHPIAQALLQNLEFPIAAPSANISTKLSSTKIIHLSKKLKDNIFILDGGKSFYGLESTIINASNDNPKILRLGSITLEVIEKIIPNIILENYSYFSNQSPGQQIKHYSPNLPLRINVKSVLKGEALLNFGTNNLKSEIMELNLSTSGNLEEAGKNLYDFLHKLDNSQSIGIAVAPVPNNNLGKTINDRLKRASKTNLN
jgi:L-threonylcarbamoyladenylate synthase